MAVLENIDAVKIQDRVYYCSNTLDGAGYIKKLFADTVDCRNKNKHNKRLEKAVNELLQIEGASIDNNVCQYAGDAVHQKDDEDHKDHVRNRCKEGQYSA